jgi:tRNA pseudouridine55 synthase
MTEGIILIDKPVGPSSFDVVRAVRKLAGIKRVGHAGTLDPMASGLLVVCLGRYTKLAGLLTDDSKVYDTVFRLGIRTTTDDTEGEIVEERDISALLREEIIGALASMRGTIMQAPPRFSAIKIDGQRAYAKARAEEEFDLAKRAVEILSIADVAIALPDVALRIHCGKGFYVRSLARDVGVMLGVGAHARSIRRIASGGLTIGDAIALGDLTPANFSSRIVRGIAALSQIEQIVIDDAARAEFTFGRNACRGMRLRSSFAVATCGNEPVAILRNVDGEAALARVI